MNHDMSRNDLRLKSPKICKVKVQTLLIMIEFFTLISSRVRLGRLPLGKRKVQTRRCSLLTKSFDESRIARNFLPSTLSRHSKIFIH
jgi:hypothetical protein